MTALLDRQLRALRSDPCSASVAEALRALARQLGAYELYAEAFAERGERLFAQRKVQEAFDSWFESAQVFEEHLQDAARAAEMYQRVLREQPSERRALVSLGLALYDMQRWDELIELYRYRLDQVVDDRERTALHDYIADLLADKKSDLNGALDVLLRAAGQSPYDLRILGRLEQLGEGTGRLSEVAVVMGDMSMHQSDPKLRAAINLRLGEMHLGLIDNPSRALVYLRSALVDDGEDPHQLASIEDFFRDRGKFDGLGIVWENAVGDRLMGSHRVSLERDLARYLEFELKQPKLALRALIRALRSGIQDRDLIEELVRLGRSMDALPEVVHALESQGNTESHPLFASFVRHRAGALYNELEVGTSVPSVEVQRTLNIGWPRPTEGEGTTEFIAEGPERKPSEDAGSLVEVPEAAFVPESSLLTAEQPPSLGAVTLVASEVANVEPLIVDEADISEIKRVVSPIDASAQQTRAELVALEHSLRSLEGLPRAQCCAELACGWRLLGDEERAEAILREGLKVRANDPVLLDYLANLLWEGHRWSDWLAIADRQVDIDPLQSLLLRLRMAEVAKKYLNDADLSERLAEEAARQHPDELRPLGWLEQLARDVDNRASLARVLQRRLRLCPGDIHNYLSLAEVFQQLGELHKSARVLQKAAQKDPSHYEVLNKLADVQLCLGDYGLAEQTFTQLINRGTEAAQAYVWSQLALIWIRCDRADEGAQALDRARRLDPNCYEALALSVGLAEASQDPGKASLLAEDCARLGSSSADEVVWLRKAAQLADRDVGDVSRARRLYRRILELEPDDLECEARLGELLLGQGEMVAARPHLLQAACGVPNEQRSAVLFFRAGMAAEDMGMLQEALRDYVRALERVPLHREALFRAGQISTELGRNQAAYDYAAQLVLNFERELSAPERSLAYTWMANAKREEGDSIAAVRFAQRAYAEQPEDLRNLRLLTDALESADEVERAVEMLRILAQKEPLASEKIRILVRAAALLGDSPAEKARRAALFETALETDPSDNRVALALAEAKAALGDTQGQVAALEHAARLAPRRDRAELQTKVSELLRLGDRAASVEALKAALDAVPDYAPAVERLQVMLALDGCQEARMDVLIRAADAAREDAPAVSERWRMLASRVAETHLCRPELALGIVGTHGAPTGVARDLLFRSAMAGGESIHLARRMWGEQCAAYPGDRLAFSRLADLHFRAGDMSAARFVWELSGVLFGDVVPPNAPPPKALPAATVSMGVKVDEMGQLENELFDHLGYAPLLISRTELTLPRPRRRDTVLMRAVRIELARPLREVVEAFSVPPPAIYWVPPTQEYPVAPGWAFGSPCLFVDKAYHVDAVSSSPVELDEVHLRFYVGRAIALLKPEALALHLLPMQTLRAITYGLADLPPPEGDSVSNADARRKGQAVARLLEPEARITVSASAYAWLKRPHRSLYEVRRELRRRADQWGLLGCGSPATATEIVAERSMVDRAQLLRFAVLASSTMAT